MESPIDFDNIMYKGLDYARDSVEKTKLNKG